MFSYELDKNSINNPAVVKIIPILDKKISFDNCFPCLISYLSQVSFFISKGLPNVMNLLSFCVNMDILDLNITKIPVKPNVKPSISNISNENELIFPLFKRYKTNLYQNHIGNFFIILLILSKPIFKLYMINR